MVIVADKRGQTDGSAHNLLLQVKSDLPIVLVTRPDGYEFNDALLSLKDYVLVDFVEYGHDALLEKTHLFGKNTSDFGDKFPFDEWAKFDNWVAENPPKIYFKRELLKKDVSDTVLPIEYPCIYHIPEVQSEEEYNNRPVEVFFNWGFSSEHRRRVHSEVWKYAPDFNYMVCDNLYYLNGFLAGEPNPRKWLTVNTPHYARHPMNEIFGVNGISKVSLSHYGAGRKCFRSAEAPLNSLMAMPMDDMAWSFDWNESNCILFPVGVEVPIINSRIKQANLYERYVNGVNNIRNYFLPNYIHHIEKQIHERL